MDYHFTATLSTDNSKRHIPHTFTIPPNCCRLHLRLRFEPLEQGGIRNMLTLTLFDPNGFRGAGHRGGNLHEVEITTAQATPGYAPGALPAGDWTVQIDTHMILPGEPCHYTLEVTAETSATALTPTTAPLPDFSRVINPNPGWYRGDLHSHTVHSDASWTVAELVQAARQAKLDFITLTDHNTVSGLTEMAQRAGNGLLTMGGQELTTFWGHAVCLGAHEWLDWRVTQTGGEMAAIANQLYERQQVYIIAHPYAVGDPYCTGCRWLYLQMLPGVARLVEVWNEDWFSGHPLEYTKNEDGLALYYRWLNEGKRLVATAGSDVHGPKGYARGPGFNVVYASELSEAAILRGIAAGHLYLSSGPALYMTGKNAAGATAHIGEAISLMDGQGVTLTANWENAPTGAALRLIVNGATHEQQPVDAQGQISWTLPPFGARWCTAELRGADGAMLALTNPIWLQK